MPTLYSRPLKFSSCQVYLGSGTGFPVWFGNGRKKSRILAFIFRTRCLCFFHTHFSLCSRAFFWFALASEKARKKRRRPTRVAWITDNHIKFFAQFIKLCCLTFRALYTVFNTNKDSMLKYLEFVLTYLQGFSYTFIFFRPPLKPAYEVEVEPVARTNYCGIPHKTNKHIRYRHSPFVLQYILQGPDKRYFIGDSVTILDLADSGVVV
jgi:hypothetical protein